MSGKKEWYVIDGYRPTPTTKRTPRQFASACAFFGEN